MNEATSFTWISPESLPQFKARWDRLIVSRFNNLGITDAMVTAKARMTAYAKALASYGHSSEVRSECIKKMV